MLTTRQKADYLMQVVKLRKLMILKDNPAFTYQHSNREQAISRVHSLQDKIVEAAVDNQVYGNSDSVNHQKTVEQTISDALENDRKRVYKSDDNRYINTAVKLNTEKYSEILNNRLNIESVKLEAKIEEEIRKSKYNGLSEAEIKKRLTSEFGDTAKLRTANIIRDALHTNEVNIGFIHALENGFQYKVWNNGRGKGKVRAWHRARFISSVSIDEPFDIFGSYHAEMMYPGDLNGGAENVANCRCWLSYTNNRPSNLRRKGSSSRSNSNSTQNNKAKTSNKKSIGLRIKSTYDSAIERIQNKLKQIKNKIFKKNNISTNRNKQEIIDEPSSEGTLNIDEKEVFDKLRNTLPEDISDNSLKYIISVLKKRGNSKVEYGQIFNYVSGEPLGKESKGIQDEVEISPIGVDLTEKYLASQHNHTGKGLDAPSGYDFFMAMTNRWENYKVILSKKEIWVIKAEGNFNVEMRKIIWQSIDHFAEIAMQKANSLGLEKGTAERWEYLNKSYGEDIKKYISDIENIEVYQVIL